MTESLDSAAFDWITRSLTPISDAAEVRRTGVLVSSVAPPAFERYAKILHRLDGHYENIDQPLDEAEIAVLGLSDCTEVRELVARKRRSSPDSRIFWREAASALGVPYAPEIKHTWFSNRLKPHQPCWPRFIYGPAEGTLAPDECRELVALLSPVTGEQECCFRLAEIPFVGTDQNLHFVGALSEVESFFLNGRFQFTPEYWWPQDHSWCVCTEYDLEFTVIGGRSSLIDSLLGSTILECVEVTSGMRVDDWTPLPGPESSVA